MGTLEDLAPDAVGGASDDQAGNTREKTKISFVYADLKSAIVLANALLANAGMTCTTAQLASWMNKSAEGGTFRGILGAARTFGLVQTQHGGQVSLTPLGQSVLNPATSKDAICTSFLHVELHSAIYKNFEGQTLPPPAAIERHIEGLGVPPKQKMRARQTFTKSAHYAGFIDSATGRFIKPASSAPSTPEPLTETHNGKTGAGAGAGGGGDDGDELVLDPLLKALLRKIPTVDEGWPAGPRARWFKTFAMNVSQIYDTGDDVVDLVITVESDKSELQQIRATE